MKHPALTEHSVAVITGGASGIGLATAMKLAALQMRIVLVDIRAPELEAAAAQVREAGAADVLARTLDVSNRNALIDL